MIKCIIFDLDGVLVDCKDLHYKAFNKALMAYAKFQLTYEEHLSKFDGLSTKKKLNILKDRPGFPIDKIEEISTAKQLFTREMIEQDIKPDSELEHTLLRLKVNHDIKLYCASNSVRKTLNKILQQLGIETLFDRTYSNQDVNYVKPHPQIYMKSMLDAGLSPKEVLIIEDSHVGRRAAHDSGAHVLGVKNRSEVTYENISSKIEELNTIVPTIPKWTNKKMNVLVPMAGKGSRFVQAGYTFPKPLIEIHGKPMIQKVVENLNIDAQYTYIVRHEDYEKYNLHSVLSLITPGCNIVEVEGPSEGAAWHTLFAQEYIENENPLVIANSDQLVEWDSNEFLYSMSNNQIDGGILTFKATHPKWSFAKVGKDGFVTEVAEKNPISDNATVGIYYYRTGQLYIDAVNQMIQKDIRTNGEYYICPTYNEIIENGGKVRTFQVEQMWGLGTPEDLEAYLRDHG